MANIKVFSFYFTLIIAFLLGVNYGLSPVMAADDNYYDLEMVSITTVPASPALNQASQIVVKVKYSGNTSLTDNTGLNSFYSQFYNFDLSSQILPKPTPSSPITTGSTFDYVFNGIFTKLGESALSFIVNNDKELPESRTSNNDLRVKVNVVSPEDLSVSSIAITPSIPIAGQDCIITATVKNTGQVDLFSNVGLQDFVASFEGFDETDRDIPVVGLSESLKVGEVVEYVFEGSFSQVGSRELSFVTNSNNRLEESNVSNNKASLTVSVASPSNLDISVSSINFSKNSEELLVGDEISLIVRVLNGSDFSLTSEIGLLERDYRFTTGGDYDFLFEGFEVESIGHDNYPTPSKPLAPGGFFSYTFSGRVKRAGTGFVSFKIDTHKDITEIDETNNEILIPYAIYSNQEEIDNFGILKTEVLPVSSSSVIVLWETDRETTGSLWYKQKDYEAFDRFLLTTDLTSWPSSLNSKKHEVLLTGLKPNEEYRYIVKAVKNDINKESDLMAFRTMINDGLNFTKNVSYEKSGSGQAILRWSTNFISNGYVYYKKENTVDYLSTSTNSLSLDHEFLLNSLEDSKYFFYINSKTDSGKKLESEVSYFDLGESTQVENIGTGVNNNQGGIGSNFSSSGVVNEYQVKNKVMYEGLRGKIILTVEQNGEAYYVGPENENVYYLGRPKDAFGVMRDQGVGITNKDLYKIPIATTKSGADSDSDGLPDNLEDALGLDALNADSDGDGYGDGEELMGGYSPWGVGKQNIDNDFGKKQKGKILLQVENNGEAWYVNPNNGKRYFLGRPEDAFGIMRDLGLGVSDDNFNELI